MTSERPAAPAPVWRLLLVIFFARTILNVGYRAVYPFLPFIASDLGISFQSAAEIIQSRNLIGLIAPLFGPLSDRFGRRTLMLTGLAISVIACLSLGALNAFVFAIVAIAAISLGKAIFDPAQQAYLGDRVPYVERGRAIALSEISWSAAALLGLPVFGIVVQYAGWRIAFVILGVIGLFMLALTRLGIPDNELAVHRSDGGLWERSFGQIIRQPVALSALLAAALNAASNENIGVVYSEWMKNSFLLDAVALGLVASFIGVAELGGELVSTAWVDRIGKHRLVRVCLLVSSGTYLLLPLLAQNAVLATLGLVLTYFFFEISVVAAIPLVSEVVPHARATLLALNVAAFALGRTLGSFTGPFVFASSGFSANAFVSAGGALLAFGVWHLFVREHKSA
ncbi:MAG: MFS transporter [Anaerolineae bacterium]